MWVSPIQRFRSRILAPTEASRSNVSARLRCSESAPRFRLLAPTGHRIPTCPRMPRCSESAPRFRHYAPTGHRIPAQGANPGNPPGKRNPRSEGTPHNLRVLDIAPGLPMRCSFRTHRFCGCGSQGVALGWYAMPIQGIWDDNSFDPVGPTWFRYRTRQPRVRSHALG